MLQKKTIWNMYQKIRLFPLRLFLLPGETAELHIFEERYKQMLNDVICDDKQFGIVLASPINTRNMGSLVEIIDITKEYPNGEADLIVKCRELFVLKKFFSEYEVGKSYAGGIVEEFLYDDFICPDSLFKEFVEYNYKKEESKILSDKITINQLALKLPMSEAEKIEFLKCETYDQKVGFLKSFIRFLALMEEQEKSTYFSLYLN